MMPSYRNAATALPFDIRWVSPSMPTSAPPSASGHAARSSSPPPTLPDGFRIRRRDFLFGTGPSTPNCLHRLVRRNAPRHPGAINEVLEVRLIANT